MKKITEEESTKAYLIWALENDMTKSEERLTPFLAKELSEFRTENQSWLKAAREGLFLSASSMARKLKIARSAYSKFEENEENGSISIATLAKAAEAMDCELVYAIRPKSRKHFSKIIWEKLYPESLQHPWLQKCDQKRRSAALAFIANKYMMDTEFRKLQGWSQRKTIS